MAKLPKAVQAAAKRANDILEQQNKPTPEVEAEVDVEVDTAPETEVEVVDVSNTNEKVETPKPQPVKQEKEQDADYWERRFKSAQGIFDSEKQRLNETVDSLESKVQELTAQLREVKKSQPPKLSVISDEDRESFDEDTLKLIERSALKAAQMAREEAEENLRETIKPLESKLKKAEEASLQQKQAHFWESLEAKVPDFREINESKGWKEWLAQEDTFSGIERQQVLTNAQQRLDASKVAKVFQAYLATVQEAKPTLENKVTPDPASHSSASVSKPDVISQHDIKAHYDLKVRKKGYRGSKQCEEMEAKIQRALKSGHIM